MVDKDLTTSSIIIFDGACILCARSIQFILDHEKDKLFRFTTLGGDYAKTLKLEKHFNAEIPDSILLYENGQIYTESTAILKIAKQLKAPYRFLSIAMIFPSFIRNPIYRFVAKNRYRWFGQKEDHCRWVPPEEKGRFLD